VTRTGVLLMAYGTPATPADVEAYYTHIRRGRPPTTEQLADLRRRYDAIGGTSPLLHKTQAQAAALQDSLGDDYRVVQGMTHAPPFIEDAVEELQDGGNERAVALVLAPHYSALSVGEYIERAEKAATSAIELRAVRSWHLEPGYLDLLTGRVSLALAEMPPGTEVVFTAHSLPERVLAMGDPYPAQLRETAEAVATRAGLDRWSTGWQSAGRTPDPWLGPDIIEVVRDRAAARVPGLLVCPAGFVSDHLEILYDLDIDAARGAREHGIAFSRTASLNEAVAETLATVARRAAA